MPEIPSLPVAGAYIADKKAAIKGALELGNVANTADADKPVSTLQAAADDAHQAAAEATAQAALEAAVALLEDADTALASDIADKQDAATAVTSVRPDANHLEASTFLITNILAITEAHYNALAAADPSELVSTTAYLIVEP